MPLSSPEMLSTLSLLLRTKRPIYSINLSCGLLTLVLWWPLHCQTSVLCFEELVRFASDTLCKNRGPRLAVLLVFVYSLFAIILTLSYTYFNI